MRKKIYSFVIGMVLLTFILTSFLFGVSAYELIQKDTEELAYDQVDEVCSSINMTVDDLERRSRVLTEFPTLVDVLKDYDSYDEADLESYIASYMNDVEVLYGYKYCSVYIKENGAYYYNGKFKRVINPDSYERDNWIEESMELKDRTTFDIDINHDSENEWTLFANTKILDEKGNTIGLVGIGIPIDEIREILKHREGAKRVRIKVTDKEGNVYFDAQGDYFTEPMYGINAFEDSVETGVYTYSVLTKHGYSATGAINRLGMLVVVENDRHEITSLQWHILAADVLALAIILVSFVLAVNLAIKREHIRLEKETKVESYSRLSSIYSTMFLINLETGKFRNIVTSSEIIRFMEHREGNIKDVNLDSIVSSMVDSSYKDATRAFMDFGTLVERLGIENSISMETLGKHVGWCRLQFVKADSGFDRSVKTVLFTIEVIDEEKRRENELRRLSQTDLMTGVLNRGSGEKKIKRRLLSGQEGMFVVIDVDKFKRINDTYGHNVGDEAIREVADCLKKSFRNNDIIMRLGGDEFAVFAEGVKNNNEADTMFERLFRYIENIEINDMNGVPVEISVGVKFIREGDDATFDDVYKMADESTYVSKKVKGNTVTYYD
ncbi:MAG: diguanylate cyclase [Lachnospiraceae bacterium]|nr:diguanylate cyclase [Lachnospiraceae bacterium]